MRATQCDVAAPSAATATQRQQRGTRPPSPCGADVMSYCLDVETFIGEVEKHPEIWDLNREENRSKVKKQTAWEEIAAAFITDLDNMPEEERQEVYKKLHCKWRNIRDSYVRDLRRKDGKRVYMHHKQLSFLHNLYNGTAQSDSEDSREYEEPAKHKRLSRKKRRYEKLSEKNDWQSDTEASTIDNLKRRRNGKVENIEFVDTPISNPDSGLPPCYPVEDEDKSFFESLLPAVREFNVDQKLEFRGQVIRLIKDMRSGEQTIKSDPS